MTSSENTQTNKVKSLKDLLLERSAVNFDKVFFDVDRQERKVLKKEICLPKGLFEFIQSKGSEICWPIPHEYLKVCLSNREALNWTNVNLSYGLLCEEDLLNVKSDFPVRQLSFRTNRMTNEMMNFIEKIAPNIEILEIMSDSLVNSKKGPTPEVTFHQLEPIRFPKLKGLSVDIRALPPNLLQCFNLKSCSKSLKHLSLHDPWQHLGIDRSKTSFCLSVEIFKCLKNLQILSITDFYHFQELLDIIVLLKNLRTLYIIYPVSTNTNKIRILEALPQLTNIFLPHPMLSDELKYLKDRKLDFVFSANPIPEELRHLSKKIGASEGIEMKLNMLENANNLTTYLNAIDVLSFEIVLWPYYDPQQEITASRLRKYEEIMLVHIRWFYEKVIDYCVPFYSNLYGLHNWSQEFIIKCANLIVNSARYSKDIERFSNLWFKHLMESQRLKTTMLDFIILNPRSALAKMYLKHLIIPAALGIGYDKQNLRVEVEVNISWNKPDFGEK